MVADALRPLETSPAVGQPPVAVMDTGMHTQTMRMRTRKDREIVERTGMLVVSEGTWYRSWMDGSDAIDLTRPCEVVFPSRIPTGRMLSLVAI